MKTIVKRLIRDEKGAAMVLAVILLLIGGLIATPLLAHMGTGLIAGEIYEKRTDELYAADAGVEDALWRIQNGAVNLTVCYDELTYNISDADGRVAEVNDKRVEVTITLLTVEDDLPCDYRIVSTATGDGSGTRIEAYIAGNIIYCSMLDHLLTVQENLDEQGVAALENDLAKLDIDCPEGCTECDICGKAYDYDSDAYRDIPQECRGCIAVYNFPGAGWPTVSDLSARYLQDVAGGTQYDVDTEIDLQGNSCPPGPIYINDEEDNSWPSGLGPLYVDGTLRIKNSSSTPAILTLDGTLYITGDTEIGMSGKKNPVSLVIELNGNTIFVESNSADPQKALKIGDYCTINGPGAIIAVGDIYFKPNGDAGSNEQPAFVLSVEGTTTIQPNIDFVGAIAGKVDVNLQSGNAIVNYPTGGFGEVNFPTLFEAYRNYGIYSYEVSQL